MEMTLSLDSIARFQNYMSENGSPANSVKAYSTDLRMLLMEVGPIEGWEFNQETARYLTLKRETLSPSTIRRKKAAFRAFGKFFGEDVLAEYRSPGQPPAIAHPIEGGLNSIIKMIEVARREHQKALVALGGLCGLRVSESISIKSENFDFGDSLKLSVFGKGFKTRIIPVSDLAWSYIAPSWAAANVTQGDTRLVPINDRAARRTITYLGCKALDLHVASHDLRSTFATLAYAASGNDPFAVQQLLGHSSVVTTQGYTAINDAKKAKAVDF